ncbi:MAG: CheR family methyltransferase [Planctomycetota bacterium]|jgi:chemotaxis protein methyltransferase CheR
MRDAECVEFLQWALPRLRLRWRGFRRVRRQVCRRIRRRCRDLGLPDLAAYRAHLESEPDEWPRLDALCHITISRFFRDRRLFDLLAGEVLPALAAQQEKVRCWCAGCASGEEPYSLALAGHGLPLEILATDRDPTMLARARAARYGPSSLKGLPDAWRERAFTADGALRPEYRENVRFACEDLRAQMPAGPFQLVCCRYLAFTYFDDALQREVLDGLRGRLGPGGLLALGRHEQLPDHEGFTRYEPGVNLFVWGAS